MGVAKTTTYANTVCIFYCGRLLGHIYRRVESTCIQISCNQMKCVQHSDLHAHVESVKGRQTNVSSIMKFIIIFFFAGSD